jgi:uncharacterized membrane protein YbaN (DUF454 family)
MGNADATQPHVPRRHHVGKGESLVDAAAGWLFVLLGIAGLFLPILQGILFILIGLLILSSEYVWANRLLERVTQRFPTLAQQARSASQRVHQWLHRCLHRPEGMRH